MIQKAVPHWVSNGSVWSALLSVPISLIDSSGVAHVLEHVLTQQARLPGAYLDAIEFGAPDFNLNARTEIDTLSFYFTTTSECLFKTGVSGLVKAWFSNYIDSRVFAEEGFILAPGSDSKQWWIGGAVHQEMRTDFYSTARQLDWATRIAASERAALHHDCGGDPSAIRHIRKEDLVAFHQITKAAAHPTLLTCGPSEFRLSDGFMDGFLSGANTSDYTQTLRKIRGWAVEPQVYNHPDEASQSKRYLRWCARIPLELDPIGCVAGWRMEATLHHFKPLFEVVGQKFGLQLHADLCGVLDLGPLRVVAITYSCAARDPICGLRGKLQESIEKAVCMALSSFPTSAWEEWVEPRLSSLKLRLNADLLPDPSALFFKARALRHQSKYSDLTRFATAVSSTAARLTHGGCDAGPLDALNAGILSPFLVEISSAKRGMREIVDRERRLFCLLSRRTFQKLAVGAEHETSGELRGSILRIDEDARPSNQIVHMPRGTRDERIEADAIHFVFNLSEIPLNLLRALPLIDAAISNGLRKSGYTVRTAMFSTALSGGGSRQLFAVAITLRKGSTCIEAKQRLAEVMDPQAFLRTIDPMFVAEALAGFEQDPASIAIHESSCQVGLSSVAVRAWRGVPHLNFLKDLRTKDSGSHWDTLERLAERIRYSPMRELNLAKGLACEELVKVKSELLDSKSWGNRPYDAPHNMGSSNRHICGRSNESVVVRRFCLEPGAAEDFAAIIVCASLLDRVFVQPVLRNLAGSYAAFAGLDLHLAEYYLTSYRVASALQAESVWTSDQWQRTVGTLDIKEVERYRRRFCAKAAGSLTVKHWLTEQYRALCGLQKSDIDVAVAQTMSANEMRSRLVSIPERLKSMVTSYVGVADLGLYTTTQ